MSLIRNLFFSFFLVVPLIGHAGSSEKNKAHMIQDLETIKSIFEIQYAPAEWKKEHFGWDLNDEVQKAKEAVLNTENITTKDYQKIVSHLFKSTKDYHVNVSFHSTESSTLPFSILGIQDTYYISYVDQNKLSKFALSEGDEILSFDGMPINEVIKNLQMELYGTTEAGTDQAMTEIFLTKRYGFLGHEIPKGPVNIQIQPKYSDIPTSFQLMWTYTPEKIDNQAVVEANLSMKKKENLKNHPFLNLLLTIPYFDLFTSKTIENKQTIGSRESFIPALGKIWWKSEPGNSYHAYLYETESHQKMGYLRIPHYMTMGTEEIRSILNFFNEQAEALVIDQVNNFGGSVWEVYTIASMLTNQTLRTPRHQIALTYNDIEFALILKEILETIESDEQAIELFGDTFGGYPVSYPFIQFILHYCRSILHDWKEGHTLSHPIHLLGIDQINPHPLTQFTKPIVLLINHLDFSGGDFFPSIMQDNKRALILGTKTAGAGGYLSFGKFPNRFGINYFQLTASIAYRENQKPIENLGVTPDVVYEITKDDFHNGYTDYIQAIHQAVNSILKP